MFLRLALAVLVAAPLSAQVGAPCPELDVREWFNSRPLALSELRGKAVMLYAFRTWSEHCKSLPAQLVAKLDKESAKGLVIIGITADEEPEWVENWIREQRAAFPIALLRTREIERAIGLDGFPHVAVIDPMGTISYGDDFGKSEVAVQAAIARAKPGSIVPAKLAKITQTLREGEYEKAWADLPKLPAQKLAPDEQKEADALSKYLSTRADARLARAKEFADMGAVLCAVDKAKSIALAKPEYPATKGAQALLDELAHAPDYKLELKLGEEYRNALEKEHLGNYLAAIDDYKDLIKKYPKLRVAAAAKGRIEYVVKIGMPGYNADCPACLKLGKACPKHLVKVSL